MATMQRKRLIGRKVKCSHCNHACVQGTARVLRKVLFLFCASCWLNHRDDCEAQMRSATA